MATAKNSAYWEKRIAAGTWKTYNSLEEKNRDLLEFYTDASEQIKKELYLIAEKYSKDGVLSLSDMHKKNRLTDLNQKFQDIIEDLGHKTEKSAKKNMQDGFKAVYENTAVGMGDEDFSMPNKKLMEKLLNEPWRGDSFSGRLWKNQKKLAVGLNDLLLTGLQQGKTATEIAVSLHNFMGQGFNECHRLVRTETMHYLNGATQLRYKDAGVEYVQIWAAEDERTCDECSKYHGKIYPIDKCPHVPFHPNCRCTIIPVTDEKLIAEYEKSNMNEPESDIGKKITEHITGISKQRKSLEKAAKNISDIHTRTLLRQSLERTTIKRAKGRKSKYSPKEKTIYISANARADTMAHELFHEIDDMYGLTENGMLGKSVLSDYNRLQNLARGYGKTIKEMLYSRYPEAFEKNGSEIVIKEDYRGISDIIHGSSGGSIFLGYGHKSRGYWEKERALEKEVFAQYGRIVVSENEKVKKMFRELFPDSWKEISETLERMIK